MAWFFRLYVAKFCIDLTPLTLPFRDPAPKVCLVVFFLLMSGSCVVASAQIQAHGLLNAATGLSAADRHDLDVESLVAPCVRGGSKLKKQDKRQPDMAVPALETTLVVCRITVSDTSFYMGRSLLPHGYHRHLHRQALY